MDLPQKPIMPVRLGVLEEAAADLGMMREHQARGLPLGDIRSRTTITVVPDLLEDEEEYQRTYNVQYTIIPRFPVVRFRLSLNMFSYLEVFIYYNLACYLVAIVYL